MATLTLDRIWVNLMSSGQGVGAQSALGREESYEISGDTRTYAGGRRRSITSAGVTTVYKFTLRLVTRASVNILLSWVGQTVQVRDHKGRLFVGVYYGLGIGEYLSEATWEVSITLNVVT